MTDQLIGAPRRRAVAPREGRERRPLRLWRGPAAERHATWLELFFDLVFVLAVAELGSVLHGAPTAAGFAGFLLLFAPVWSTWTSFSYFADQFEIEEGPARALTFLAMLGSIAVAVNAGAALTGGAVGFVCSYVLLRLLLIALYLQAARTVPTARPLCLRYAGGFALAVALWLLSLLVPEPGRFWVWGAALLVELGTWVVANVTAPEVPAQVSHMPERFGLFTLIVLGEAVVVVGSGIADTAWQPVSVLAAVAGFGTAIGLWWLYFDRLDVSVIDEALAGGAADRARSHIWGYGHLFVFGAIVIISVGIELAIEEASHATLSPGAGAALGGGAALYLLALTAVQWATPRSLDRPVRLARLGAAAGVAAVGAGAAALPPAAVVLLVLLALGAVARFESGRQVAVPGAAGVPTAPPGGALEPPL